MMKLKKKWGQKSNLGVLKMKELCFCFADIWLKSCSV